MDEDDETKDHDTSKQSHEPNLIKGFKDIVGKSSIIGKFVGKLTSVFLHPTQDNE